MKALLEQFVEARLFTDGTPYKTENLELMKKFQTASLPTYILFTPQEEEIARLQFTKDEKEFLAFLNKALKR